MLILNKTAGVFFKPSKRKIYEYLRSFNFHPGKVFLHKLVLGIETSCDDTAAAVVDETGNVWGEAIHSQTEVHLKWNYSSSSSTASQRKHSTNSTRSSLCQ
ncbi:O-sialoglycoprotein endopeptidase like 1 [Phyllostomus discolor]|uniref:O-sialoglycoprotein endopeptidase like 1 n=1 Tax=Phyllostomus discolor TaxID=89673 RepID=A0A834ATP2_9CHIR|nr:O-sialoglycoprotein endopeptidase like 1 [Phyllostomus discolor]